MADPVTLTGALAWSDDWLLLTVGPWTVAVADLETYPDGSTQLCLHGWIGTRSVGDALLAGVTEHGSPNPETAAKIVCLSRAEAGAACVALLALRGIACPALPGEGA